MRAPLRLYFLFFFLKRSGCCSWVGIRANMSLPQVVLLPAGTRATCANAAKDRLDRKKPVSASLETELESQPQNMINFNEVAKMRAFRQTLSESLVCFLSAEVLIINFKRVNLKSKSLLPWVVGRRSLQVMQQIGRQTPPWGKSLS